MRWYKASNSSPGPRGSSSRSDGPINSRFVTELDRLNEEEVPSLELEELEIRVSVSGVPILMPGLSRIWENAEAAVTVTIRKSLDERASTCRVWHRRMVAL
jgi:hypothetical protein